MLRNTHQSIIVERVQASNEFSFLQAHVLGLCGVEAIRRMVRIPAGVQPDSYFSDVFASPNTRLLAPIGIRMCVFQRGWQQLILQAFSLERTDMSTC